MYKKSHCRSCDRPKVDLILQFPDWQGTQSSHTIEATWTQIWSLQMLWQTSNWSFVPIHRVTNHTLFLCQSENVTTIFKHSAFIDDSCMDRGERDLVVDGYIPNVCVFVAVEMRPVPCSCWTEPADVTHWLSAQQAQEADPAGGEGWR